MFLALLLAATVSAGAAIVDVTPAGVALNKPRGMTFADGRLWVSDSEAGRVLAFAVKADGSLDAPALTITGLAQPMELAVAAGELYVAETKGGQVSIYDAATGEKRGAIAVPAPRGVWMLAEGILAVTSGPSAEAAKVMVFDTKSEGMPLVRSIGPGPFEVPWGLMALADGSLLVADMGKRRVLRFKADGTADGELPGTVERRVTVMALSGGVLKVAESPAHRVLTIDLQTGALKGETPSGAETYPQGIGTDGQGHLFLALTGSHRIVRLEEGATEPTAPSQTTPAQAPASVVSAPRILGREKLTVVCLGDSVTMGVGAPEGQSYPDQLQGLMDARYGRGVVRVINAGIGGNTSAQGLARLETDVLAQKPEVVLINFGLNDSSKNGPQEYRCSPEEYRRNLETLVTKIRVAGAEPILSTVTPVLEEYYFDRHPQEAYGGDGGVQGLLGRYNAVVWEVAASRNVAVADLHRAVLGGERELLRTEQNSGARDGVHFTAEGYRSLALEFFVTLCRVLEH